MYKNDKIGLDDYFKRLLQNSTSENDTDIDSDDLYKQKESYDEEFKKNKSDRYRKDTIRKNNLARWVMWVVSIYLLLIFLLMFIIIFMFCKPLSDAVIITLLGTTTINVLGLMYIVLKGYFKN
ncbi:hypothetical protein Ga0061079_1351 [Apibacter mensalis]|jgi:hypothetical protein|uniref:Uncharacterized protein n=1 Tax=Apibacter mensalis TaxID=1586267 RepID=A0A0X3AQ51_9FLAO|nr:hypothetical protein Ga0061079_1351 [Apibacter mensalis]